MEGPPMPQWLAEDSGDGTNSLLPRDKGREQWEGVGMAILLVRNL